jgi:SET domain
LRDVPPNTDTLELPSPTVESMLVCGSDTVAIAVAGDSRRLVAARAIPRGAHLFDLQGRETEEPTRYSVQIGADLHLDTDDARDEADLLDRYFWRYLDHSCEPSSVIRDRAVYALRDIAAGEGVTFDYNTTELDMAEPFQCYCGTSACVGTVRGARHLTPAQRQRVAHRLPSYLK